MSITATRFHDFSYGHRVVGHEGKCAGLHGHNGRVHFTCHAAALDAVGRVIDFSVINECLCQWVEQHWDHKMLLWDEDLFTQFRLPDVEDTALRDSIVLLDFNPTAENLAHHLLHVIGPIRLAGTGVELVHVVFEETRKCSVTAML